jgi:hypothetical protein
METEKSLQILTKMWIFSKILLPKLSEGLFSLFLGNQEPFSMASSGKRNDFAILLKNNSKTSS